MGELERLKGEFESRKVKTYVVSGGDDEANVAWLRDVHSATGYSVGFPIIHDPEFEVFKRLGMLGNDAKPGDDARVRDAQRGVFLVDGKKIVRLVLHYPATVGWCSHEILRCFDALFRADQQLATPVNWIEGRDAFLQPDVETADALRDFPRGLRSIEVPSGIDYLRLTPDPLNRDDVGADGGLVHRRGSMTALDETSLAALDAASYGT